MYRPVWFYAVVVVSGRVPQTSHVCVSGGTRARAALEHPSETWAINTDRTSCVVLVGSTPKVLFHSLDANGFPCFREVAYCCEDPELIVSAPQIRAARPFTGVSAQVESLLWNAVSAFPLSVVDQPDP